MRCINKHLFGIFLLTILLSFTGCKTSGYDLPYDVNTDISAYSFKSNDSSKVLNSFAENLCVVSDDINSSAADLSLASAGCLFDLKTKETLYSKSAHLELHPASTTKIMTCLLALKYGHLDDILTASKNVEISEPGAQLCGFKEGDRATLEQVLYGLMVYSGNDAGVMVAEYISGSVDAFAELMNQEAQRIGATNTHFKNPHGLTDEEHLTCAYDLYLMFNEALKYDKFKELINTTNYQSSYTSKTGDSKKLDFKATNRFITGGASSPDDVVVVGGKTGTTKAAGACLVLYSNNKTSGDDYISVVMHSESTDSLYENMKSLLNLEK